MACEDFCRLQGAQLAQRHGVNVDVSQTMLINRFSNEAAPRLNLTEQCVVHFIEEQVR